MKTLKAALAGLDLSHSISPEVHHAIFPILRERTHSEFGAIEYTKLECATEDEFRFHVKRGGEWGFTGINVTNPYKQVASSIAVDADGVARQIQSANTMKFGMGFSVTSTDGPGFHYAVAKELPELDPSEYDLTIIGAGGAARAICYAARDKGWRKIVFVARSPDAAKKSFPHYAHMEFHHLNDFTRDESKLFVVQATPVGQRSHECLMNEFDWREGDMAFDMVYNPLRTKFLDCAAARGIPTISGLGMLLEQAALSQHIWMTGKQAEASMLTLAEYQKLKESLSPLLAPRWDVFAT